MGGFDRGAEQLLARGETFPGGFGAAMFAGFLLELDGFLMGFADHPGEGARQHPGFAWRIDRNRRRAVAAGAFDRGGQLHDRAGERARQQYSQYGRAQHRDQSDQQGRILDRGGARHDHRVGRGLDHRDPFIAGQDGGDERYAARPSASDPALPAPRFPSRPARWRAPESRAASRSACRAWSRIRALGRDE